MHRRAQVSRGRAGRGELDEAGHVVLAQPADRKRACDRLAGERNEGCAQRVGERRVDVAVRTDDHHATLPELARGEPKQQERRGVRGVQVVEHEDQRLQRRHTPEEGAHGLEEAKASAVGLQRRHRPQMGEQVAQLGQEPGHVGGAFAQLRAETALVRVAHVRPDSLNPRPVGRCAARLPAAAHEDPRPASAGMGRELLGEAGLPDARLAPEQDQPPAPGEGVVQGAHQVAELAPAADEDALAGPRRRHARGLIEAAVLAENPLMQLSQPAARLDAELLGERGARGPVDLERLALTPAAIEREHELTSEPLAEGVRDHEGFELPDDLRVMAAGEIGADALLERENAQLLQSLDLRLRESLVGQVGERRAAPQCERLAQQSPGDFRLGARGLGDEPLEARGVDLGGIRAQQVSRRARLQAAAAELLAEASDVGLDALGDRRRRRRSPEVVDQPFHRYRVVGVQQQDRQQRPLLGRAEGKSLIAVGHFQRPENPEVHFSGRRRYPHVRSRTSGYTENPSSPSASSSLTSSRSTRAWPGPSRHSSTIRSTASGSPSKTASTVPSDRLAAQPATPRCSAARRTESRKNTPCTRPWARTRFRARMAGTVDRWRPRARRATWPPRSPTPAGRVRPPPPPPSCAGCCSTRCGTGVRSWRARAPAAGGRSRSPSRCGEGRLLAATPAAAALRADPEQVSERAWLLVAAVVGALVDLAEPGPPVDAGALAIRAGDLDGFLVVVLPAPGLEPGALDELAPLAFEDHAAGIDRLVAVARAVPGALLADVAGREPIGEWHPLWIAEAVARLGGRPADARSVEEFEDAVVALLEPDGERAARPHEDPDPARRVARRILQRLDGMGKWGGYHTDFAHLARGFAGNDRRLAQAVGEALIAGGLLDEKPSVGQRHVFLNPRRAADIHRLIHDGAVPPGLRLP